MKGRAECYQELREFCETVPLVDCHDHSMECGSKHTDPITAVLDGYFVSDILSASSDATVVVILDEERPLAERWPLLEKAWKRTKQTGYGLVVQRAIREFYGEDDLTLDALGRMGQKLIDFSNKQTFEGVLTKANIAVRLADVCPEVGTVIDGSLELPPRTRLITRTTHYRDVRSYDQVQNLVAPLGRTVSSLDEYIGACREIFEAFKRFGAVGFKDQSAYTRPVGANNPTRHEAEEVFNWFMDDPRRSVAYPDGARPLHDYLFHAFLRMARDLDLPFQIHTGHMAGSRNDIVKTNAVGLTGVLELHRDVRFDLFHANWPYSGEILYLVKNFPNVTIDFCWVNIIDPIYCQNLFKQALSCVPHGKIHGYGSDFGGYVDHAWAHAQTARENIAIALSDMVEIDYIDLDAAKEIAHAWQFGNANEFFRLGM